MVLNGYKTKISLVISVIVGLAEAFGVVPDVAVVNAVQVLAALGIGYGLYDKIDRK